MLKNFLKMFKEQGVKKLAVNSIWLTLDNILRVVAGFFVGIWVARYLGPDDYGRWNYALSYVSIFAVLIGSALNNVVVRELVRSPEDKNKILGSSFILKLVGALAAFALSILSIFIIPGQSSLVRVMVLIVAAGTIFQSFEVVNYWFESKVASSYAVCARSLAFIIASFLKIFFVIKGYSVIWFALASAAEIVIGSVAYIVVYRVSREKVLLWRYDMKTARRILIAGLPLILAGIVSIVYSKVDKILVGSLIGPGALGNYSVGTMLTDSWSFIATAVAISVYPSIIYTRLRYVKLYESRMKKLYSFMVAMALVLCLPISVFARPIVHFLYGARFDAAAVILSIYVWTAVPAFLDVAGQKWLYAENLQKYLPIKSLIGSVFSITANLILIPRFGITAAAVTALLSISIATYFSNAFFKETRPLFKAQTLAIIKPRIL